MKASLAGQLRLDENSLQYKSSFLQLKTSYELAKRLSAVAGYRGVFKSFDYYQRLEVGMKYEWKYSKRLIFSDRLKYQHDWLYNVEHDNSIRNKLGFSYNIKKSPFSPFGSAELFYEIGNETSYFSRYRLCAGTEYKINKKANLEIFLGYQSEMYSVPNKKSFLLGVEYGFKI